MNLRRALILAVAISLPASLLAQDPAATAEATEAAPPPPELVAAVESCDARKFETTVDAMVNGTKRSRKVKLCGKVGQSDAEWVATLKDAVAKTELTTNISAPMRAAIIAALNDEIARFDARAPVTLSAPGAAMATPERPPEYSALPPMPAPKTAAAAPSRAGADPSPSGARPAPPVPSLTIRCLERGERGEGRACDFLERDTLLSIRADADLANGATLRLLRKGNVRGDIDVAPMKSGQTVRVKLPSALCAGVATSKAEIQILPRGADAGAAQVATTLGPYGLRC